MMPRLQVIRNTSLPSESAATISKHQNISESPANTIQNYILPTIIPTPAGYQIYLQAESD